MDLHFKHSLALTLTLVPLSHSGQTANTPTEPDPTDWIVSTPVPGESWISIASHQGVTVLGSLSGSIYYSTDLIHWNQAERPGSSPMWNCISTDTGFMGAADSMLLSSEDGVTWDSFPVDNLGVTQISISDFEKQWILTEALYGSSILFKDLDEPIIDNYPAKILFSNQGSRLGNLTTMQEFHNVRGEFVMGIGEFNYQETINDTASNSFVRGWVARFPDIFRETNGVPDPQSIQFASGPLYSLAYSDDVFVMTGAELESRVVSPDIQVVGADRQILAGTMYYSENSLDWSFVEDAEMPVFYKILYKNQRFVAAGREGWIWSSADGLNWDNRSQIEEESAFQALHYNDDGTWMAAGMDGTFTTASVLHHSSALPTVTIRTEGVAVEDDPSKKVTVFWESDRPLTSELDNVVEFSSVTGIANVAPATDPNAILQFTAIYDQVYEGDQFIEVSITSNSPDYRIGLPNKARIRILDATTDRWRQRFFPDLQIHQNIADWRDYDQDGFRNIMERFFGTDPLTPTPAEAFKIQLTTRDGHRVIEAQVSNDLRDMEMQLEISQDGTEWAALPLSQPTRASQQGDPDSDGAERETVYWQLPNQDLENAWFRLSAVRRP